ncbi:MAG: peptidase domain-containing ABC transporter [Burkholderiaceae bacterium]|nr:peptidase domain-containing ABC transporter [Burkholderiaceae bacterium]MDO9089394.1 peptidase domain-containing ABC transporter [Burkholderiaceae bacterium]
MAWYDALSFGLRRRLPVVLQTEAAECGLACLAMVLNYHGVITDLTTLRTRHAISLKGMTLNGLTQIAQAEKLGFRAVRLDLHELPKLRLPAILHWELNHFVVLKAVSGNKAVILDPAFGERRVPMEEVSRRFTGVALELWPDPGFTPREEKTRISLSQLIGQVSGFWPSLTQVLLLSLALEIFVLVGPLFMQWIIDHVLVSRDANLLTTLALGFLLLLVLQQGIGLLRSWMMLVINTSVRVQWQANIFSHLIRLPMAYFQKRHLGDVVSRTGSINEIQRVLTSAFVESLFDGLLVLLTLVMMFIYSPLLASIGILAVLLYLVLRLAWYRPLYLATEEHIVRGATLSTHFLETIRGIRAIKLFARQIERRNAWQTLLVGETNAGLTISKLKIIYGIVRSMLSGTFNIVLLWVGATQILENQLSVGMLMAFLAYRSQFESRITGLIDQYIDLKMLQLYGERLADVVLTPAEADVKRQLTDDTAQIPPDVVVDALRFRYADQEPWVLNGLSFSVKAGEAIAIAGNSGGGKTTLVNILLGVLKPVEGSVFIGGAPLEQIGNETWRRMVGTVMQDDTLFAGSIADNISFFDAQPEPARIEECARLAAIHDDIQGMAMGYQTLVGDMGTVLSGGQKQRVLLARALYKRPRVLILDEATSHLDLKREAEVNRSIAALNITRIVIAHRPETIGSAKRVIEIERGAIVYDGDPAGYFERIQLQRTIYTQ